MRLHPQNSKLDRKNILFNTLYYIITRRLCVIVTLFRSGTGKKKEIPNTKNIYQRNSEILRFVYGSFQVLETYHSFQLLRRPVILRFPESIGKVSFEYINGNYCKNLNTCHFSILIRNWRNISNTCSRSYMKFQHLNYILLYDTIPKLKLCAVPKHPIYRQNWS